MSNFKEVNFMKAVTSAAGETKKAWGDFQKQLDKKYPAKQQADVIAELMVRVDVPEDLRERARQLHPELAQEAARLQGLLAPGS
ncbi:hypothetical protein [Streptomyces eurocidicus]|uniref:Sec-independent protein translocase protein TatA n=1 Tax=Streptomyces eurocidicus TaxID=66423 RepID=A0A7W8EZS2_STREU|nr:hypothetical protein [Streptomyces eurocidicus]MBB5117858.1 Sec-independent protein translocase protein TatA [Streptomyces eurocidicus]MBF6056363.1 hypothetical protein [Streptomyces eurocidicus]